MTETAAGYFIGSEACNLVVHPDFVKEKVKEKGKGGEATPTGDTDRESEYDKLIRMASGIAKNMSNLEREELLNNQTPEKLKEILERH